MGEPIPEAQNQEPVEYNENTAVLKKDLMLGLLRTENGPAMLVNLHGREEIIMAKGEVDAFLTMRLMQGDMKADAMRNKIVPAKGGILDFARKKRF